jgi:ATP-dependent helicase/nuclease subunit B
LRLKALKPLDEDPGAADLGSAVHKALHEFTRKHPGALPADALARLLAEGETAFRAWLDRPNVWAFWQPRFQRIAAWWLEQERERRPLLRGIATELKGSLSLPDIAPPFTLTARADRIDTRKDGALAIIDYKTGQPPGQSDIDLGFAPQLALEAAMALARAFPGIEGHSIAELAHWQLTGNREGGSDKPVSGDAMELAAEARDGLIALVTEFGRDDAAYAATPDPLFAPRFDDYDHLARTAEWSSE